MSQSSRYEREVERHRARTPRSRELQEEAAKYLPGGSSRAAAWLDPYPVFVVRGQGTRIYDADGNEYLDFMINATSLILGHAHPLVVKKLQEQASKGTAFANPTEHQTRLAKILCQRIPSLEQVRFVNSGTEATLNALRAARAYTGKYKIAKFEGAYHGTHDYAAVSVKPSLNKLDPAGPTAIPDDDSVPPSVLGEVVVLPYNDLETSQSILRKHQDELAALIMEPVFSAIGYVPGDRGFLQGIREMTQELGILLIYDEVQSFRIAPGGAQEHFGITPDLTAMGKIIGGGMPAGAFGGRKEIMALFDPSNGPAKLPHAGTFNANPMTMVAGATTLEQLTPETYGQLNRMGDAIREKLQSIFDELDVPAQVTGIGSLFGIHFTSEEVKDYRSAVRADGGMKKSLVLGMQNEGVILFQGGTGALAVPHTESDVDTLMEATRKVVQRLRG